MKYFFLIQLLFLIFQCGMLLFYLFVMVKIRRAEKKSRLPLPVLWKFITKFNIILMILGIFAILFVKI